MSARRDYLPSTSSYLEMAMSDSGMRLPSTTSALAGAEEPPLDASQHTPMPQLRETVDHVDALLWRDAVHGFTFHGGDASLPKRSVADIPGSPRRVRLGRSGIAHNGRRGAA